MSETGDGIEQSITARKMDASLKDTPVLIKKTGRLGSGLEGSIDSVNTSVELNGKNRSIGLAYKEFNSLYKDYIPYDGIFECYALAKQAGLPVPTTFRATEDKKGILMTDLTHGGENVVISQNQVSLDDVTNGTAALTGEKRGRA